ncbi:MAG TPA: 3-phosphoshikimate 1-carboxyvinyltransferase, partial [Paracoccus sp.]|nr:3-phosphoshikimate 1-carboxyvinyltransferase [Paracoccus sp. (in: a-proteobacteria)]
CGNSGTGVRLIMGAMATTPITATFTGDASLSRRPMARVTDPLSAFGAQITAREGGRLPITIQGAADPVPLRYRTPVASAQIKSAILLAGLNSPGETVVIEAEPTRDHSERMLAGFGAQIRTETTDQGHVVTLAGRPELRAQPVAVPRDPSSAAFPVAAALIVPGSQVRVPGVSRNRTRDGLYVTLLEMGADIAFENEREEGGEPVADLVVRHGPLTGVTVPADRAASMIDEFPILSVIAAFAEGRTVMNGVAELRVKESDRIDAMARGLAANGVEVEETRDTMVVHGMATVPGGASVVTHLDHRIAMSFLILGLAAQAPVSIDDASPIATSFPDFLPLIQGLGGDLG